MKYVINIPKEFASNPEKYLSCFNVIEVIKNGTPLEDILNEIKTTIHSYYNNKDNPYDRGRDYGLYSAKQIINNYIITKGRE